MSATLKLTSKRQATLPKELCAELGVGPGDRLEATRLILDGEPVWVLRPQNVDWEVLGSLARYARGRSHDMEDVRASIAAGRQAG